MTQRVAFEGEIHEFPDDFTDADIATALQGHKPPAGYSDVAGGAAAVGRGLFASGYDELQGGLQGVGSALFGAGQRALEGRSPLDGVGQDYQHGYRQGADSTRAYDEEFHRQHPWTHPLLVGTGGALPVAASMGVASLPGMAGAAARAATTGSGAAIRAAASRPVVAGAVTGGAYGAANHVLAGVTPQERFDPMGVAGDALMGAGMGGGAGALFGHALPGAIDMIGGRFLTPEQKAASLIKSKVLDPQKMTMDDVRLQAQRMRGSSSGATGEHVAQAMGPINGPGWRAARAVAQVQGPGQGIAQAATRASRFGTTQAGDDLASRAAGMRINDLKAAAIDTGFSGQNQSRSGRLGSSVAKNVGGLMDRPVVSFPEAATMVENGRRGFFPQAYEDAFKQPPANVEAATEMPSKLTNMRAITWAADQLTASPEALEKFPNELGNEEARIISALSRTSDPKAVEALQSSLDDVRNSAQQLRTIAQGGHINGPLRPRAAAMYKRGLDQIAASEGQYTPEGSSYVARGADFRQSIHDAYPKLAEVDRAYAGNRTFRESMDLGRKALNMHPGELDQTIQGLSDDAFDAFLIGLHDDFQTRLGNNQTGFASKIINNPVLRQRLDSVLGPERAKDLLMRMARETNGEGFSRFVLNNKNSTTAPLTEDMRAFTDGAEEGNIVNDLIAFGEKPKGFIVKQIANMYDRNRLPGIKNAKTNEALARMLFAPATDANVKTVTDAVNSLPWYGQSTQAKRIAGALTAATARAAPAEKQRQAR